MPSKLYSPIFAASWMSGQGVSSRSSHSAAAGRTTPSANPRTQSGTSRWSSVSSIAKPPGTGSASRSGRSVVLTSSLLSSRGGGVRAHQRAGPVVVDRGRRSGGDEVGQHGGEPLGVVVEGEVAGVLEQLEPAAGHRRV